jgi:MFS family permease
LASAARLHCAKTPLRATQPSSHMRAMSTSPQSKHAVSFVFIVVLIDMMGFGLIMPVLPRLIEEVGQMSLSDASIIGGWLFFVYGAAQFVVGPAIGNLSDAYGRRPIILLSVVGQALDFLMHALAPTLLWLFAARLVSGFCGASYTTANAYIADITGLASFWGRRLVACLANLARVCPFTLRQRFASPMRPTAISSCPRRCRVKNADRLN